MLFTRCPQCTTTFRVTDEALAKAGGRVRCGRCASVFDARAELVETMAPPLAQATAEAGASAARAPPPTAGSAPTPAAGSAPETGAAPTPTADPAPAAGPVPTPVPRTAPATGPAPHPAAAEHAAGPKGAAPAAAPEAPPATAQPPPGAAGAPTASAAAAGATKATTAGLAGVPATDTKRAADAALTAAAQRRDPYEGAVAAIVAEVERGAAASSAEDADDVAASGNTAALTDRRVHEVLDDDDDALARSHATWTYESAPPRAPSKLWLAGAALALIVLAIQIVHHYRRDLAISEPLGPLVQRTYAALGMHVVPNWDVRQYEILDWVAAAEPNARGQGTLEINARIFNRGPRAQPYPHVHVELTDRWEETVGRRTFSPSEYLLDSAQASTSMAAGATVQARLRVVDPGPDATGFELDVCVEAQRDGLTCGTDEIFRK